MSLANVTKYNVELEAERALSRLEYVILSVLYHHDGHFEEIFSEWVAALRVARPCENPRTIRETFVGLWEKGFIELASTAGRYRGKAENHEEFFSTQPFKATLTSVGRMILEKPRND